MAADEVLAWPRSHRRRSEPRASKDRLSLRGRRFAGSGFSRTPTQGSPVRIHRSTLYRKSLEPSPCAGPSPSSHFETRSTQKWRGRWLSGSRVLPGGGRHGLRAKCRWLTSSAVL
jgi:hypothetical protein